MPKVQFLVTPEGEKIYVHEPPAALEPGPDEQLITETISQAEYEALSDPTRLDFRVYSYAEGYLKNRVYLPTELDYRLLNLHRKETFDRGLRVRVDYFGHYEQGEENPFRELVVSEHHSYQYMPYRMIPTEREILIEWLRNDGSVGCTKTKTRHFLGTEGAKVHEKRKQANVMNLKAIIFGFFTQALGADQGLSRVNMLFGYLFQPIETYTKGHEGFLIDAIAAYDEEVFDYPIAQGVSLRQYLISELDIPKFIPEA